jgi:hypothetical protein
LAQCLPPLSHRCVQLLRHILLLPEQLSAQCCLQIAGSKANAGTDQTTRLSKATTETSLSIVASLVTWSQNSMPYAHARLRSAVPLRWAMIDRTELFALFAARFRRIRGLSDREDTKHQSGYSKNSECHGTLLGCPLWPILPQKGKLGHVALQIRTNPSELGHHPSVYKNRSTT